MDNKNDRRSRYGRAVSMRYGIAMTHIGRGVVTVDRRRVTGRHSMGRKSEVDWNAKQ